MSNFYQEPSEVKESENVVAKKVTNGDVAKPQIDLSRQSPDQITDVSTLNSPFFCGHSCSGESRMNWGQWHPPGYLDSDFFYAR